MRGGGHGTRHEIHIAQLMFFISQIQPNGKTAIQIEQHQNENKIWLCFQEMKMKAYARIPLE